MILLLMTQKDREELESLIAMHPNTVQVISADRFRASCKINVPDGAIYWDFIVRAGEYQLIKTRRDDNALTFQDREVYRLAWLSCKEKIVIVRKAQQERNERKAANPSPAMSKKAAEQVNRAKQRLLPLELHTHHRPTKWRHQ